MRFRKLKPWEDKPYLIANPRSEAGDPNVADRLGYDLVTINADGMMVYRRKPWWRDNSKPE